eukprot:g31125.t1
MGSDLKEMKDSEQQRLAEHLSLMEAKRKQQQVAMKAMEEKMLRLGELKVEMQVLKDDLKDFVWPYQSNQQFATDLNKTCEDKEQAWSEYQALQAQELEALSETVEFLSKDQVRDAVGDATKGAETARTPFVRPTGGEPKSPRLGPGLPASETSALGASCRRRLMRLRPQATWSSWLFVGKNVAWTMWSAESMTCMKSAIDIVKPSYGRPMQPSRTRSENLRMLPASWPPLLHEELDAQVAKTTAARQAERAAFEKSRDTNNAALELLEVAEKRLQRFYATSSSLAETGATQARIRRDPQAPKADLSYQKQGQGFKVLQLFTTIKADVQKQTQMLQSQDAVGQSEYENLVKNSNQKKMADNRSLGSKQAAKAELEADIQRSREELRSLNQVLGALREAH